MASSTSGAASIRSKLSLIRTPVLAATLLLGGTLIAAGCQPFSRHQPKNGPLDDWEPPQTSSYARPKKYKQDASSQIELQKTEVQKASAVTNPSHSATTQPADKLNAQVGAAAQSANPSNSAPFATTGNEDIDIDSAIAVLPPELQKILRAQLENKTDTGTNSTSVALHEVKSSPVPVVAQEQGETVSAPVKPASQVAVPDAANVASAPTLDRTNQTPEGPVRVSLSDSKPSTIASAAPQASASENEVKPASVELAASSSEVVSAVSLEPKEIAPAKEELSWEQTFQQATQKLKQEIAVSETLDPRQKLNYELALRALYMTNNQLDQALEPIPGLEPDEQEYFRHQLQALHEATNPSGVPVAARRWALVMESQRKANEHLANISNLEVRNPAFCTEVQGYGVITRFVANQFKPDQDVLLYCELENVSAEKVKDGFETQFQGTYEIYDRNGKRIADQLLPMETEVCINHRRDYFVVYRIYMPLQIAPGSYELRLTIEDMKGKKFGQTKLDFQIQKPNT